MKRLVAGVKVSDEDALLIERVALRARMKPARLLSGLLRPVVDQLLQDERAGRYVQLELDALREEAQS